MKIGIKTAMIALVAGLALFTAACPKRVSIGDVLANPGRYQNKSVAVAGTVEDSWGLNVPGTPLRGGAYKIDDGTGSIWIITQDAVPGRGVRIGVKGKVASGVNIGGRSYGVAIREEDRRYAGR